MGWFSLPNRREISLLLFSLAVFIFSYNLGTNLSPHSAVFRKLGLAGSSVIGNDGRRPPGLRDKLENAIFGEWRWDQGHIAGDGAERSKEKGPDLYGAQWLASRDIDVVGGEMFGTTTADEAGLFWGNSVPITTLVKHVPGQLQARLLKSPHSQNQWLTTSQRRLHHTRWRDHLRWIDLHRDRQSHGLPST